VILILIAAIHPITIAAGVPLKSEIQGMAGDK
jgi:hypothetical protein